MRILMIVLLALPLTLVAAPSAAACTYTPIVTVGGSGWPSEGVYVEQDCYFVPGASTVTVHWRGTSLLPSTCHFVPAVFVLGEQVPGTGTTSCTPPAGTDALPSQTSAGTGSYPDVGVVVVNAASGCCIVSTHYVNWVCEGTSDTGWLALPTGDQVRVTCTVA